MNRGKKNNEYHGPDPKTMTRAKHWSEEVEQVYRFQVAGYRDEKEYQAVRGDIDRWPGSGFVKKLQRRDGYYYYFNRYRECTDKDVNKCKIYSY